jgi:hypothetical protein
METIYTLLLDRREAHLYECDNVPHSELRGNDRWHLHMLQSLLQVEALGIPLGGSLPGPVFRVSLVECHPKSEAARVHPYLLPSTCGQRTCNRERGALSPAIHFARRWPVPDSQETGVLA